MQSNRFGIQKNEDVIAESGFTPELIKEAVINLRKSADKKEGGFGQAPKFPQSFSIQFLLHHHYYTKDSEALEQACLSLDKMIYGGIY
ncbi:hypothetical protein AB9E30_36325, partial [Rhizobium leguminosarum]